MFKLYSLIFLLLYANIVNAQMFIGKSFKEVHHKMAGFKNNNINGFIEEEDGSLSYGIINDKRKSTIYKYSAIFDESKICIAEAWSNFKTKEEAFNKAKTLFAPYKLNYIKYREDSGDIYVVKKQNNSLKVCIKYVNDGYEEYIVTVQGSFIEL